MRRTVPLAACALAVIACGPGSEPAPSAATEPAVAACWDGRWQIAGALREVNLHGRLEATTPAASFFSAGPAPPDHALGAIGGLRGEYTLWDDTLAVAIGGESPRFELRSAQGLGADPEGDLGATFAFGTRVPAWTVVTLPEAMDLAALEGFLAARVEAHGVGGAMPFRVEGAVDRVELHVVDPGSLPAGGGASCAERKERSHRFGGDALAARVVGVFTTAHTGVMVDHTTSIHAHAILADGRSGHVDALVLPPGARIAVPREVCPTEPAAR